MERNSAQGPQNEMWWKAIFYVIFWGKMVHVMNDWYFSLLLKGFKIFLNLRLSLIVHLKPITTTYTVKCEFDISRI